ncbi:MAG TPA: DUF5683 domain-containing protein [Balneolaceae bacterium]|nr:DUF5683 domain-containing protein [Balneolaceae bacterium]
MLVFFGLIMPISAQPVLVEHDYFLLENRLSNSAAVQDSVDTGSSQQEFPQPKSVMLKSLMVPGWGQIINKQAWKVPIVYGLYAGVGYYTYTVHQDYRDYKAAYYNSQRGEDTDFKFGPTPERLQGVSANQLRSNRNSLRNRRDLMFVVFVLAHGLNAVDAYVFAHMRSFDVSDDLSAKATVSPDLLASAVPGIKLSLQLNRK